MSNVKVVIGANFGDEGKGLMTDYFCSEAIKRNESCIVVLSNGGAQRGHTVVTPDGIRHVFHHFGSGTLVGAATYLSEKYILNPMTFRKEYKELEAMGFSPKVYAHSLCMWSTPYDMIYNQILEDSRGERRHGSCGMGIWETIKRYEFAPMYQLKYFNDSSKSIHEQVTLLEEIRDDYFKKRLEEIDFCVWYKWVDILSSHKLVLNFIEDIKFMCDHVTWVDDNNILKTYQNVIFENGQGLLLDQNQTKYGNNTTPSNTGIKNPHEIISHTLPNADVEVCYVTRTYLTRHGAGRFDEECNKSEINALMEDKTNVPNPYQGSMRYGKLNTNSLFERIKADMNTVSDANYHMSLAITHINECDNEELLTQTKAETTYYSYDETRNVGCK